MKYEVPFSLEKSGFSEKCTDVAVAYKLPLLFSLHINKPKCIRSPMAGNGQAQIIINRNCFFIIILQQFEHIIYIFFIVGVCCYDSIGLVCLVFLDHFYDCLFALLGAALFGEYFCFAIDKGNDWVDGK